MSDNQEVKPSSSNSMVKFDKENALIVIGLLLIFFLFNLNKQVQSLKGQVAQLQGENGGLQAELKAMKNEFRQSQIDQLDMRAQMKQKMDKKVQQLQQQVQQYQQQKQQVAQVEKVVNPSSEPVAKSQPVKKQVTPKKLSYVPERKVNSHKYTPPKKRYRKSSRYKSTRKKLESLMNAAFSKKVGPNGEYADLE